MDVDKLIKALLRGEKRATAKLLTLVESCHPLAQKIISKIYDETGKAHVIGITGSPGSGKSTLIARLVREIRMRRETVGVIAVDPTSPYSGGAFLGDRVRMQSMSADEGVFIRSMATRGGVGGVSRATRDAVRLLEAWGADVVLVETVGAGQSEVGVIRIADTVVLLLSPGAGDEIQAFKAGIMEIADIYVVNKADVEGADRVLVDVGDMLSMGALERGWVPPILKVSAKTEEGVSELLEALERHREHVLSRPYRVRRGRMVEDEVLSIIQEKAANYVLGSIKRSSGLEEAIKRILEKELDPYTAVEELLSQVNISPQKGIEISTGKRCLETGITHVYTGDGKGKTSAALGLALRALGTGLTVYIIQFIKSNQECGEHLMVEKIPNLKMITYGRGGFIEKGSPSHEDVELAGNALKHAREIVASGEHDVVILDEVNVAMAFGLVRVDEVLALISGKPENVELVLTGRGTPEEIIEAADLVTEMVEVKHPYNKGLKARRGIDY